VSPMAAVANAIYRAVGVRMTELPMSPPKLLKAMLHNPRTGEELHTAAAD
jgi:CO/xanthine dehydrogenase Mo-binding subunit